MIYCVGKTRKQCLVCLYTCSDEEAPYATSIGVRIWILNHNRFNEQTSSTHDECFGANKNETNNSKIARLSLSTRSEPTTIRFKVECTWASSALKDKWAQGISKSCIQTEYLIVTCEMNTC